MDITPLQTALCLLAVSFAGALLPLYRRWSDRGLHIFVSVSAGIFLGTIFLHLLPHLAGVDEGEGHAHRLASPAEPSTAASIGPWVAALIGLLLLFVIEKVWLPSVTRSAGSDPHKRLWVATYVGLSLHAMTEGIALTAILEEPGARTQFLISFLIHKATETFSLATVMRLAHLDNKRALVFLFLFAAIAPCGLLFGRELLASQPGMDSILTGFACGTFLYVAICDLLPEVFHGAERPALKLASVVSGILLTAVTLPHLQWALQFGERVARESFDIFLELSPYLLVGFVIAGVLNQVMKTDRITRHLAGDDLKSVVLASLIGAPLPLCSCSVVPVAVSMRRAGASKGATASFLIATPETGVDSVTVSWALLDPFLTIARPIGAIVSAIFTGAAVNWVVRRRLDAPEMASETPVIPHTSHAGCEPEHPADGDPEVRLADTRSEVRAKGRSWPMRVLRYAFVEMIDDLSLSLILGILLSGLIGAALPAQVFQSPLAGGFGGLVLMLAIGIPVYVCAAASTPIAAALILKGMSPGAAFVFLLASPATNLGSLFVLSKQLGRRVVLVQVLALSVATLALGWLVDRLYPWLGIVPSASMGSNVSHLPAWLSILAAVLLAVLLLASLVRSHGARDLFERLREAPAPTSTGTAR